MEASRRGAIRPASRACVQAATASAPAPVRLWRHGALRVAWAPGDDGDQWRQRRGHGCGDRARGADRLSGGDARPELLRPGRQPAAPAVAPGAGLARTPPGTAQRVRRLGRRAARPTGRLYRPPRAAAPGNPRPAWPSFGPGGLQSGLPGLPPGGLPARRDRVLLRRRGRAASAVLRHGLPVVQRRYLDSLPGDHDRRAGHRARPFRAGTAARRLPAGAGAHGRRGQERRHLGDRAARRFRYRRDHHGGAGRRRWLAPDRPQVVHQQRRFRHGAGHRPARGRTARRRRAGLLPGARPAAGWRAEPLLGAAAQGQAGHARPADRRGRAGGRLGARDRRPRRRAQGDDGGARLQPHP